MELDPTISLTPPKKQVEERDSKSASSEDCNEPRTPPTIVEEIKPKAVSSEPTMSRELQPVDEIKPKTVSSGPSVKNREFFIVKQIFTCMISGTYNSLGFFPPHLPKIFLKIIGTFIQQA